ncbi:hypothetical protein [uncultured Ramlibacter sp.]|uniref:hypothetical protein n=1 Tax=uncultured Ramlibacter sp. TaxID=260755 RepID=UPI0026215A06|nr:hypothetical protein [uncultured Ramlibacter sp.]
MKHRFTITIAAALFGCTQVFAQGLCLSGEQTYFACEIRGSKKSVAVCGGTDWLQYRFGTAGNIELGFPAEKAGSLQQFTGASRVHRAAGVAGEFLMFAQSGTEYSVMQIEGGSDFNGVSVLMPGAKQARDLPCDMRKSPVRKLAGAVLLVPEGNP